MHPFPRIHPRWHKSQVDFDHPDLDRVPNYVNAKAYEAILNPGDVLYVPPYWWHHVHSITASGNFPQFFSV
jgi:hypoxia-inducible factor 1-alpha inhibitor (HIF hydroxylase)